jgi:HAD superfamily phosphatase (TIGR01681 family)
MVEQPTPSGLGNRGYLQMLKHGRELTENAAQLPEVRVALLADHATQQMTLVLKSAITDRGFFPLIYEADYGTAATEAYDRASRLYDTRPEIVYLSLAVQKYRDRFLELREPADREGFPQQYLSEVLGIVDVLRKAGMRVIVSNFALPAERLFGNFSVTTRQSPYSSVLAFNALLAEAVAARGNCYINDVMYIASRVGGQAFVDERLWASARYPCAPQFLPDVARSAACVLAAVKGRVTKCIVLDLDNTLWGGVVGDDGKDGIRLGGDAYGESFVGFQRYLLNLQRRGYVLAVCSKNEHAVAVDAFRNHPEMVLKEEDVSVFVANWNDKASNIEYIARVLNLGLGSFVFVDERCRRTSVTTL